MFDTLLIANRGEIACRVAATARRMGLRTVAVYSDADAHAAHVAACDIAVHIGASEPRASYLRGQAILQAARETGAQAIHPGYGFLSENEAFAQAVTDAGLVFVGPPAAAIAAMGSKSAAKALMEKAGVPLVPGYHGDNQDPAFLKSQADAIGYPVLIKASAGGGGKGMRIVESPEVFLEALASCQREAASSFGDDRVLIERYLQKPRHIEIQVFADRHGQCVYLFERDCSVQRRHQKVIEEAPAPGMTEERRKAMGQAAIAAARAVGYVGAGTVEFIVEPDGRFYFMEMNTRLQVEHPVTEMITGHDLVEWQLRVAAGQPLPANQDAQRIDGHAIEVRVYAENPEKGFLPSIGTLTHLRLPEPAAFRCANVRIDAGVRTGDTITPHYDPMIAKLIVHGADREQARARMLQALAQTQVVGVHTNVAFLSRLMRDTAFAAGDLDTSLIERRHETLLPASQPLDVTTVALATAAALSDKGWSNTGTATPAASGWTDPWSLCDGWRVAGTYRETLQWSSEESLSEVTLTRENGAWSLTFDDATYGFSWDVLPTSAAQKNTYDLRITLNDRKVTGAVVIQGADAHVSALGYARTLTRTHTQAKTDHGGHIDTDGLKAPMPGRIVTVNVEAGQQVSKGQALLVMEAMKMEHTICAPADGIVQEVFYAVGDQVAEGSPLIAMDAATVSAD
ncbi:acetyl/propionyl/methylcrotonyl-CoA carboxylase subunit alpha [Bordetella sp. 15P40C-2]|uniref:acetyl/propionyl/methylcrotonyl-CoA carboxylase subunit alpha n=1 Tax=Bordetella sp. 15P40C-2 TaxID=2572246 RepID=UPI001321A937|nr:biotin/lipoyl-binding protein [Bordetella sp. 15P40C-2]